MKFLSRGALALFLLPMLVGCPSINPEPDPDPQPTIDDAKVLAETLKWNRIAIDASGFDHMDLSTATAPGPVLSARAMAIAHIAMADVVAASSGEFLTYSRTLSTPGDISVEAAIAQAAHDTLIESFPAQAATFDAALAESLDAVEDGDAKTAGIAFGAESADLILAARQDDGSGVPYEYIVSDQPGAWRPDPINPGQMALGEEYFQIKPFVLNSVTQFRAPAPPAIDSAEYAASFDEVKRLGGDGITTPTERTDDQTIAGIYWAYDGTPSLCAPPRLYNQITTSIAEQEAVGGVETARLLALVNVGMADAGISCWESKYHYNYWRPVTGIREADEGMGPTGLGDGNDATIADPTYVPLCAPASNVTGGVPNFTPPFPAYPSGHATFGGALFETLREFFGTDEMEFTFVSDEYNGVTQDNEGNVRPLIPRTFSSLSEAEEENGQSRIYLGIHWSFDKTEGISMGNQVADHVMSNAFQPVAE